MHVTLASHVNVSDIYKKREINFIIEYLRKCSTVKSMNGRTIHNFAIPRKKGDVTYLVIGRDYIFLLLWKHCVCHISW